MLEERASSVPEEAGEVTNSRLTEADLVAAFLDDPRSKNHGGVPLHEFETLAGIPDVVFVEPRSGGTTDDMTVELADYSPITNGHATVLASLHRCAPRRVDYLARVTGLAPSYVRRIVNDLKSLGLVATTHTGSVRLADDYCPPNVRFTALEFKLTDWRRALAQAIRHRSFAATATVVMPCSREPALRRAAHVFREYGVGAAVFDSVAGRLTYIVKPRVRTPTSARVFLDAVGRAAARAVGLPRAQRNQGTRDQAPGPRP